MKILPKRRREPRSKLDFMIPHNHAQLMLEKGRDSLMKIYVSCMAVGCHWEGLRTNHGFGDHDVVGVLWMLHRQVNRALGWMCLDL